MTERRKLTAEIAKIIDQYIPANGIGTDQENLRININNDLFRLFSSISQPLVTEGRISKAIDYGFDMCKEYGDITKPERNSFIISLSTSVEQKTEVIGVTEEEIKSFASDSFNAGRLYQNESNIDPQNFTTWFNSNKGRLSPSVTEQPLTSLPSLYKTSVIAIKIAESIKPELTAQEQAFFIAGFQECVKWLSDKTEKPVNPVTEGNSLYEMHNNKIELLKEDIESVHLYLDDIKIPRHDGAVTYSIVGRIKHLLTQEEKTLDVLYMKTDEEILEKNCPSMNNLYLDDQGRAFRGRILKAMNELSEQQCELIHDMFNKPCKELKPLEDLWRKENPHPKFRIPDRTQFYKWIRIKILGA